jgi:hypothetical protein
VARLIGHDFFWEQASNKTGFNPSIGPYPYPSECIDVNPYLIFFYVGGMNWRKKIVVDFSLLVGYWAFIIPWTEVCGAVRRQIPHRC